MIEKTLLGRYECVNPLTNTNKFWHVVYTADRIYVATWGRIGKGSPAPKTYTEAQVRSKIKQKIKKGYVKKEGYLEVAIENYNSIHFITEMCAG